MKIATSLFFALAVLVPSICFSASIDGYKAIKFNMSLEEVKTIVGAESNGTVPQDMWAIFRLTRFESSLGCLLGDNKQYEQGKIIDVYDTVRDTDSKLSKVKILVYADSRSGQQVQVYFYNNKVMYLVVSEKVSRNKMLKSLSDKYGSPAMCGPKTENDYFITGEGGIKVGRYAVEYFNIPLCKEHADAMIALAKELRAKIMN